MKRREFLGGLTTAATLGALPATARAVEGEDAPLLVRLGEIRALSERAAGDALSRMLGGRPTSDVAERHAAGIGAMTAVDLLATVPFEDQAHPRVQDFIREALAGVGEGVLAARDLLGALLDLGTDPDADAVDALFPIVASLSERASMSDAARPLYRNGLDQLRARVRAGGLRAEARRAMRRLDRAIAMAQRMSAEPARLAALSPADTGIHLRFHVGRARWGSLTYGNAYTAPEVLGLIACGIGIAVASFYGLVAIACGIACGSIGLVLVGLVCGLIAVGCVYGMIAIVRRHRRGWEPYGRYAEEVPGVPTEGPSVEASAPLPVWSGAVPAAAGWFLVPDFLLDGVHQTALLASGTVVMAAEAPAVSPAGDASLEASADDLVPGEPLGMLVARVGDVVIAAGAATVLAATLSGPVYLAVNGPSGAREGVSGGFDVRLLVLG